MNTVSSSTFDVIITGAGPAGAACALSLKKSGLRIALVDKSTFPRDKICGDSVASPVKRILRQIDPALEQEFLAFPAKSNINKATLYSPDGTPLTVQFRTVSHCVRRKDFDHWLFSKATEHHPTLSLILGHAVVSVERSDSDISVTLADGSRLSAPLLIACDGAHSVAARSLGGFIMDRRHYSGAVRRYYANVAEVHPEVSEVYFLKDYLPGYFWIFPLNNHEANVGFGMLSSTIAERRIDLRKSLETIIATVPHIAERFASAIPLEETKGFGLPLGSQPRVLSGDRLMLCGDAASLIDPFSGEGIAPAIFSGVAAAEQAMACHQRRRFDAAAVRGYDLRIEKKFRKEFHYHYQLQRFLGERKWLINGLFKVLRIPMVNRRVAQMFY